MIKSFNELRTVDVSPYIKQRDGADYLPWATVVDLMHEHGAEKVFFPLDMQLRFPQENTLTLSAAKNL